MERSGLLLLLLLNWGLSSGRVVKVPEGTLYRVVGTPVNIPCNVSHYQGPLEQNFDWFVIREHQQIKIVSTLEPEYSDAEYKDKIQKKEIWVERLSDNSVELHFKSAQLEDKGVYQCQTPSTDENSSGNYEDTVTLEVIPDGLTVLSGKSRSVKPASYTEGKPLELQCVAMTTSSVCTHLSVTWQLKENVTKDILSFTQENGFQSGGSYKSRYQSGDIRMGMEKNGIFKLIINHLRPEDDGVYSCVAAEWVKEDGSNWKKILEKNTDIATIKVQRLAQTLKVSTIGGSLTLNKGDEIDLICNVTGVEDMVTFEVSWYFSTSAATDTQNDKVLVHLNRAAIVNNTDFVTLSRISDSDYRLRVQQIDETDSGYYYCTASIWIPYTSEMWHKAAERRSSPVGVTVGLLDPIYTVQLNSKKVPSSSGEPAELECRVLNLQNADDVKLTVTWYFNPKGQDGVAKVSVPIATMDQDWTLKLDNKYKERAEMGEMVFMKPELHAFKFQIQHALVSDRGEYFCNVTAWIKQRGDTWLKKQEIPSVAVDIFWKTEDPSLSITATEEKTVSTRGNTFEMSCSVSAEHVEVPHYSVAIAMNEPAFTDAKDSIKLISLTPDSVVKLESWDVKDRSEDVVLEKIGNEKFRFRLYRTQFSDEGSYYCIVQAWVPDTNGEWSEVVANSSNTVAVAFKTAAPRFNVTLHSEKPNVHQGETVEMNCTVDLLDIPNNSDVLYEVEWFLIQQFFNTTQSPLVLVDQRSVVTHLKDISSSDISVERTSAHEFRLRVHCSGKNVAGNYFCKVTPWIKSETGLWQKMPPQQSNSLSIRVDISVLDSFKMPLIYGIGIALLIGILACTIGYCASRYCSGEQIGGKFEQHRLIQMSTD
ncbi:prostaglandin F2 receptor negative regulator-like [Heterodontus francisci]|uniref:prostaglandin F2 receptor negative regulator-like n=1 Tax=Heterodontus francisci TaxID=7792 RepID=UPI00355C311C